MHMYVYTHVYAHPNIYASKQNDKNKHEFNKNIHFLLIILYLGIFWINTEKFKPDYNFCLWGIICDQLDTWSFYIK